MPLYPPPGGGSATKAWVFDASKYGAVGDGVVVTDGAITSGTPNLACTTSTPFKASDVGKVIMVPHAAGGAVMTLVTTILAFVDSGHVTLAVNAGATVSGGAVLFATDDTVALQACINAAVAYGQLHGSATVSLPVGSGRFYGIGGALVTGGITKGNAQLTLPVILTTVNKVTLTFEGPGDGSSLVHWEQLVPQTGGATLISFFVFANATAQTNSINAAGNPAVIGGPSQPGGFGISPGVFSNMNVVVRNLSILTTHSRDGLTISAMDLSGVANAGLENFAYGTTGTVAGNDYASVGGFANGIAVGLLMPAAGNNDSCVVRNVTCHGGYTYGFFATEHCDIFAMRILYCWAGFCPVGTYDGSVGSTHAIVATLLSVESCTYVLYVIGQGSGGVGPFLHLRIDTETSTPRFGGNGGGAGLGSARGDVVLTGLYTAAGLTLDAVVGFDIVNGQQSYPLVAVSADYAVKTFDEVVAADATAGNVVVTVPTVVGRARRLVVFKVDSSVHTVTVQTTGGEGIRSGTTKVLNTQWTSVELLPNSTLWLDR